MVELLFFKGADKKSWISVFDNFLNVWLIIDFNESNVLYDCKMFHLNCILLILSETNFKYPQKMFSTETITNLSLILLLLQNNDNHFL